MSDIDHHNDTGESDSSSSCLLVENERLREENEQLSRQAQDVASANAYAAELMVQLEETNESLEAQIERRKAAEEELQRVYRQIEAKVQQRTAELSEMNQRLIEEIGQRKKIERTLAEQKLRLDTILSTILTGVVIVDSETHEIVDANPFAAQMIGVPRDQLVGKVCHQFICPAEQGKCPISDLGQTIDQSERMLLTATGERVPILKTVNAASWQGREYLVESFVDISARKEAEDHRSELLDKLEAVNTELRDFAYIVSHDLKAPLRGIRTLADWLSRDYGDRLDAEGREQLRLMVSRVDRMHNLIDGILQYSRVGRVEDVKVPVNLDELIPQVVDAIAPPASIAITVERALPTLYAEPARITQVFQNLLSNAVKYMDKPQGRIRIDCVEEDGFWKFSVADNGPGIDQRYFDKIFRLFQTLSSRDQFESTGIGLALVKRIIETYGGRIWLESKVGEGTSFLFTWPQRTPPTS
jgi:two-component system sensor kinase FixL